MEKKSTEKKVPRKSNTNLPKILQSCIKNHLKRPPKSPNNHPQNPPKS